MVDGLIPADVPTAMLDLLAFDGWVANYAIQQVAQGSLSASSYFPTCKFALRQEVCLWECGA